MNGKCRKDEKEIRNINEAQEEFFGEITHIFDPPLPEGVPERLDEIVSSANIKKGDVILDVGSGTGILLPLIRSYNPEKIYACDLSEKMIKRLKQQHPFAVTIKSDVRNITLPDDSLDVVFVNACYSNLIDKKGFFVNISRMIKHRGRLVISHPMGRSFIDILKKKSPFPLDDFPDKLKVDALLKPYNFHVKLFIDKPLLYILVAVKQ